MCGSHLYLNLFPESLVASQLAPENFGAYMAIGKKFASRGIAIFFELDPAYKSEDFPFHLVDERCVPHPDGSPKHSVYLGVYRVLERIPISALGNLYLTTDDGRVLELTRGTFTPEPDRQLHHYQELCPVTPRVVSRLDARDFCHMLTDPSRSISLPRLVFAELILNDLAIDPKNGGADNLPFEHMNHLRNCLDLLLRNEEKNFKSVSRHMLGNVLLRTIRNGVFVGDNQDFAFYPIPSPEKLDSDWHSWWRSAQTP